MSTNRRNTSFKNRPQFEVGPVNWKIFFSRKLTISLTYQFSRQRSTENWKKKRESAQSVFVLQAGWKKVFRLPSRIINFVFSKASTSILGLPSECALGAKRSGRESDQGTPSSAERKVTETIAIPALFFSWHLKVKSPLTGPVWPRGFQKV